MPTRRCRGCHEDKPLSDFGMIKRPSRDDPERMIPRARCNACNAADRRAWYAANPERGKELARRQRAKEGKELQVIRARRSSFKRKYGITIEEYAELLGQQRAVCAACHQPETAVRNGELLWLAVDHDHADGRVRGLLCSSCNLALGHLGDSTERLKQLIYYLERGGSDAY